MSNTTPPIDAAFDPIRRRHSLNLLLLALPDAARFHPDSAVMGIRMRIEQVSGARPFLDAGEQALADEWLAAASQAIDVQIKRAG